MKKLDHPNIIKIINFCLVGNHKVALILEYGSGGTLKGI
jgi:serine/threonine protein kinase